MRSLEVRIPISPRPDYFNRVRVIALSIRDFYPGARIRVTVGTGAPQRDLFDELPWSRELGIEWQWVGAEEFLEWSQTQHPYIATMMERFRPPFGAEFVLMLDADVIAVRGFDELFAGPHGIKAMMAHGCPFGNPARAAWEDLFAGYGLHPPAFDAELSGWGIMENDPERRYSPPYFNTGVLFAPAAELERLYEPYVDALRYVRTQMDSYFFEQIALTLALANAEIPVQILPLRYNYPNQAEFDSLHPGELADVRLLHFLRTDGGVRREEDFETIASMRRLASREDLAGSNEVLRDRLAQILEHVLR